MRRGLLERINAGNPVGSGPGEPQKPASPWGLRPAWVQIPPPAPPTNPRGFIVPIQA